MTERYRKLETAKIIIFRRILKTVAKEPSLLLQNRIIEIFLMIENKNLLHIGPSNRYIVNGLENYQMEDMLNILMQFDLIKNYERVCGEVFKVSLIISPRGNAMVININKQPLIKAA